MDGRSTTTSTTAPIRADKIILGLPLYGRRWPTADNTVPSPALATGPSIVFEDAWAEGNTHGRDFEADAGSPYTHDGTDQIWYGDTDSVAARIVYVRDETPLAGIGFWALHYTDDPDFWQRVHDETRASSTSSTPAVDTGGTDTGLPPGASGGPPTEVDPDLQADAGLPFLAYVGDRVILSAEGSRGPAGATLEYRWTQLQGPAVILVDTQTANPSFDVRTEGNLVFQVEVGDGSGWSAPATSYIVVVDPGAARRHVSCGCANSPRFPLIAALPLLLAFRRRRRCYSVRGGTWQ